ncbi:MAG: hypothetical protein P4N59_21895 [Negativicutes bacterium]|nr:hypothetical protein [Negativicutes bacterium]
MKIDGSWRVILNECKGKNSRIIFSGRRQRSLIDITIQSEKADQIIDIVQKSDWNSEQLIVFLDSQTEKIFQEAL